jgi:hypothetical protein
MKRRDDKHGAPNGHADERRRQFEESRGLRERPELPLDENDADHENDADDENDAEDDEQDEETDSQ